MRILRDWWRRLWGWWLLTVAAAVTAALSAVGQLYAGLAAAIVVAVGGSIAAAIADRGRVRLAERTKAERRPRPQLYVSQVNKINDPIRLGVHPAAAVELADGHVDRVPPFVERDRMADLKAALLAGGFVLVVGDSAAGKTRLAYETMRACLPRHVCVKPEIPDALAAAIETAKQKRPSVVWLDDLERYLGIDGLTRTDLAELLDDTGGRIVVLATMRAHERDDLSSRHDPSREQSDRQLARAGREVLYSVHKEIRLEPMWSNRELTLAGELVHDSRIAQALNSADKHGLAETMAAGPQLLKELQDAWSAPPRRPTPGRTYGDARGAALVSAAVDVRRAGYHRPLPLDILQVLHEVYLRAHGRAAVQHGSWENAFTWATQPLHATRSMLEPADNDCYLAFDYLVDAAARDPSTAPIADATWQALIEHAEPADVVEVAWQTTFAGHVEYVTRAFDKALGAEQYVAAARLAECLGDAGQDVQATKLLELTINRAENCGAVSDRDVLSMRQSLAWELGEKVSGHGNPKRALEVIRRVAYDSSTILGETHPDTLRARIVLARQLGASGNPQEALTVAKEVAALAVELLGADHEVALSARFEVAVWTRHIDGAAVGAQLFYELLEYAESLESVGWSLIIDCMWNLGGALVDAGDFAAAVSVLDAAVQECRQVYGDAHRRTMNVRLTHADAVGSAGDSQKAAELLGQLAHDSSRVLGDSHLTTLEIRHSVARWTGGAGDKVTAVQHYEILHADVVRLFDENHWLAQNIQTSLVRLAHEDLEEL